MFPKDNSSIYDLSFLEYDTIYYANEKINGLASHPLADLFFISNKNELVLVDITGGDDKKVSKKKKKLVKWINENKEKIFKDNKYKLRGVVLAPNVMEESKKGDVSVVSGESAKKLLGGLRIIAQWSEEDHK